MHRTALVFLRRHTRRGAALAMTVMAIVVIGILIAGAFFSSTQEYRIGRNRVVEARSLTAAEFGQYTALSRFDTSMTNRLVLVGDTLTRAYATGDGSFDTVRVTKIARNTDYFWLHTTGVAGSSVRTDARKQIGLLLWMKPPSINIQGAVTTRGGVRLEQSILDGRDTSLAGWNCPPAGTSIPGVADATPSTDSTWLDGCSLPGGCFKGNPPKVKTPLAADTSLYSVFGDQTWADLTSRANIVYTTTGKQYIANASPKYLAGGACNTGAIDNFGDINRLSPAGTCEPYMPIIWAKGSLELEGGSGQGILLVERRLRMAKFNFNGLVIVRDTIDLEGSQIHGAVLVRNRPNDNSEIEKNGLPNPSLVRFSACALNSVTKGIARPAVVKNRSWTEVF